MRGAGVPPDHLLAGPARRDGALPRADRGRRAGAALERQPGRRRAGLGRVGGPVPEAVATCSRWSRASWSRSRTASSRCPGATWCSRSGCAPATRTAAATRWTRSSARWRWDEPEYGREYDLDGFMIVAVDDFNMGAMENKGLNIFNSRYVLASPETATDADYEAIEAVVAHEYFHNWTGNRITCRDWFQLSPEGGADGLPRPAVRRRHALAARSSGSRTCCGCGRAVPRGRRAAGAPGPARRLPRDQQLLHGDGLREGRRGDRHAAPAGRARRPGGGRSTSTSSGTTARPARSRTGCIFEDALGRDLSQFSAGTRRRGTPRLRCASARRTGATR